MVSVPKKVKSPLSLSNARGVLCEDAAPKLVGRIVRRAAIPAWVKRAGEAQAGSVPGGGTEFTSAFVRAGLEWGRCHRASVAILFTDVKPPSTPC